MSLMGDWEILHRFAEHRKLKVELGTCHGLSAIMLSHSGNRTVTIDRDNDEVITEYLKRFHIECIKGDTSESAVLFEDESIDLLFIDGGHEHEQVRKDYLAWYPKVKYDAVILFHDMDPTHVGVWDFYLTDIKSEIASARIREIAVATQFSTIIKTFVKEKK
jgi:hypothetical protein